MVVVAPKPLSKKDRKGRFRRSKSYNNRGRNSETDQDYYMDISSSDTTPDPIYVPKLPTRLCISPTGLGTSTSNALTKPNPKIPKLGSADSLLALFRKISGSNSAPPSPQYSENEESSTGIYYFLIYYLKNKCPQLIIVWIITFFFRSNTIVHPKLPKKLPHVLVH
jgi:hypothetical protein